MPDYQFERQFAFGFIELVIGKGHRSVVVGLPALANRKGPAIGTRRQLQIDTWAEQQVMSAVVPSLRRETAEMLDPLAIGRKGEGGFLLRCEGEILDGARNIDRVSGTVVGGEGPGSGQHLAELGD